MTYEQKQKAFVTIVERFKNRENPILARIHAAVEAAMYLEGNGPIRDEIREDELPDFWLERAWSVLSAKLRKKN